MRALLLALVLATLASTARAEPTLRIGIVPFRGKGGPACSDRLREAVAESLTLVPIDAADPASGAQTYEELLGFLREHREAIGAEVVVLGTIGPRRVVLEAYDRDRGALLGLLKLGVAKGCRTTPKNERKLIDWLLGLVPGSEPFHAPPPPPPPPTQTSTSSGAAPPVSPPAPHHRTPPPPAGDEEPEEDAPDDEMDDDTGILSARGSPLPALPSPLVILELDLALESRSLSYANPTSAELRAFGGSKMGVPGLRIEVRPFRSRAWLEGIALSASLRRAFGVSAERVEGGPSHTVKHSELSATLAYRAALPGLPALIVPTLGLHVLQIGLSAPPVEPNLPAVGYTSFLLGLGVDVPLQEGRSALCFSASYLAVLSEGAITSSAFLGPGSARGLAVEGSLRYGVIDSLSLFAGVRLLGYGLSFLPESGGRRHADSAADDLVSVRFGARYEIN